MWRQAWIRRRWGCFWCRGAAASGASGGAASDAGGGIAGSAGLAFLVFSPLLSLSPPPVSRLRRLGCWWGGLRGFRSMPTLPLTVAGNEASLPSLLGCGFFWPKDGRLTGKKMKLITQIIPNATLTRQGHGFGVYFLAHLRLRLLLHCGLKAPDQSKLG